MGGSSFHFISNLSGRDLGFASSLPSSERASRRLFSRASLNRHTSQPRIPREVVREVFVYNRSAFPMHLKPDKLGIIKRTQTINILLYS